MELCRRSRKGFTLIEFGGHRHHRDSAAILFPVFARARERPKVELPVERQAVGRWRHDARAGLR